MILNSEFGRKKIGAAQFLSIPPAMHSDGRSHVVGWGGVKILKIRARKSDSASIKMERPRPRHKIQISCMPKTTSLQEVSPNDLYSAVSFKGDVMV